jgi:hypothetical protein
LSAWLGVLSPVVLLPLSGLCDHHTSTAKFTRTFCCKPYKIQGIQANETKIGGAFFLQNNAAGAGGRAGTVGLGGSGDPLFCVVFFVK